MKNEKTLGEILRERKEITNIQSVNNFVDNLIHSLDFLDHRINQLKNEEKNDYLMEDEVYNINYQSAKIAKN